MEFQERVLKEVVKIPRGKALTYKKLALKLNSSPRAVAKALASNPWPIKIPCHRVVMSNGKVGGYKLGKKMKIKLLRKEGVRIKMERLLNFNNNSKFKKVR